MNQTTLLKYAARPNSTGQAHDYFMQVTANIGAETLRRPFDEWSEIERQFPDGVRAEAVAERIFAVEPLREAARRIIMLTRALSTLA